MFKIATLMGGRISRLLLVLPMILGIGILAIAGQVPPRWDLKVDGQDKIVARSGDIVTFTLHGQALTGATAFLSTINSDDSVQNLLPYVSPDKALPLILKFRIPASPSTQPHPNGTKPSTPQGGLGGSVLKSYFVNVIGKTSTGLSVTSNSVQIAVVRDR